MEERPSQVTYLGLCAPVPQARGYFPGGGETGYGLHRAVVPGKSQCQRKLQIHALLAADPPLAKGCEQYEAHEVGVRTLAGMMQLVISQRQSSRQGQGVIGLVMP